MKNTSPAHAMPTVKEIEAMAYRLENGFPVEGNTVDMLRAVADHMRESKPVAWRYRVIGSHAPWVLTGHAIRDGHPACGD